MSDGSPSEWQVYRDGKRVQYVKVASVFSTLATTDGKLLVDGVYRINLASCPGRYCQCAECKRNREEAMKTPKAPLGQKFGDGPKYIALILATQNQIRVLGLFTTLAAALSYVKANYKTEPLGKTRFTTAEGHVLIVQQHVHVLSLEEA